MPTIEVTVTVDLTHVAGPPADKYDLLGVICDRLENGHPTIYKEISCEGDKYKVDGWTVSSTSFRIGADE